MTKNRLVSFLWLVAAIAVLAAAGWGGVAATSAAFRWHTGVQSELSTAIVAAGATVVVSLLTLTVSRYFERRDAVDRENRQKKIPAYEDLIAFVFNLLHQERPGQKKMSEAEMISTYSVLTQKMVIWGGDDVLRRFGEFRVASLQLGQPNGLPRLLVSLEGMMLAIRKDLGYRNANLAHGDVLRLFINDLAGPSASGPAKEEPPR